MPPSSPSFTQNGAEGRPIQREIGAYVRALKTYWSSVSLPADVADALAYIHEHMFVEGTNASQVCDECGLRNHNISSIFKKHVGVGMRRYIEMHRIAVAKQLLQYGGLAVVEITWSVGYTRPETFCRAFRRNVGCAPTDYRSNFERNVPPPEAMNGRPSLRGVAD